MTNELNYIKDENFRENITKIVKALPDYFWTVAASSTGKYHPEFSLGEGGLIRHTKAAVRIAKELFELYDFESWQQDMIIGALIIHDGLKHGYDYSTYTAFEHPLYISNFIDEVEGLTLSDNDKKILQGCVASHMGKWNTNKYSNQELPKPITEMEKFVHMCDYLSSRKFLNIKFIGNEIED